MSLNLFGSRRNDNGDQRGLVTAAEPVNEDGGEPGDLNLNEGSHMSYHDVLAFVRRRKCMFAFMGTGILLLLAIIIGTICATANSGPVVNPTTPAPLTPTTSATTTTTPSTTTTTTSTTTSTTTTTSKPTTTSATTTSTTSKPTTTSPTTTTSKPTTTSPTTTTSKPTTTSVPTTTSQPPPHVVPTVHPLPQNTSMNATMLLNQVFNKTQLTYAVVPCVAQQPPTFRYMLKIDGVSEDFFGESDKKTHAREAVARSASEKLFGISYDHAVPIPKPEHPCNGAVVSSIPTEEGPPVTDN